MTAFLIKLNFKSLLIIFVSWDLIHIYRGFDKIILNSFTKKNTSIIIKGHVFLNWYFTLSLFLFFNNACWSTHKTWGHHNLKFPKQLKPLSPYHEGDEKNANNSRRFDLFTACMVQVDFYRFFTLFNFIWRIPPPFRSGIGWALILRDSSIFDY